MVCCHIWEKNVKEKILVTGAGGFIGSHLVERLVELGHNVVAFVRYNSLKSKEWLDSSPVKDEIEIFYGDIRDQDSVEEATKDISCVYHLAALIDIPYSYLAPRSYVSTNVIGTQNILHAAMRNGLDRVVLTSTSETLGTAQYVPMDEEHPIHSQSPYAASKASADQLGLSYFSAFDCPVFIVRPFNVYGPRQSDRAVIPSIIKQLLCSDKVSLGNVYPTRDFTYVTDTVEGFIEIAKNKNLIGTVTHIGSNEEVSIEGLVQKISKIMNKRYTILTSSELERVHTSEVSRLLCDNSKLKLSTDWTRKISLEDGLRKTVDWFERHNRNNPQCKQ
jgi:dTDP-glucose 4,6-dehydratase